MPNTHSRRRRDSTVELSRVGGVHRIRNWLATVSTSLNNIASRVASWRRYERTRRQSSWASCKLCSHRRRDSTRQLRRVGAGGVYWAFVSHQSNLMNVNCLVNAVRYCKSVVRQFTSQVITATQSVTKLQNEVTAYADQVWEVQFSIEREICAIAKMTARCVLYMGALKICWTPWLRPLLLFAKLLWAFVLIDPMNVPANFQVRSFNHFQIIGEPPKNWAVPFSPKSSADFCLDGPCQIWRPLLYTFLR